MPEPCIKGRVKSLHPTVSVGCNYLYLPLNPSMSQHFSYSVHTKHYAHRLPFCDLISVDFGHIFHIKDYFAGTGKLVLLIYM